VEVFPQGGEEGGVRSGMGSSFTPRVMLEAGGASLRPGVMVAARGSCLRPESHV
jgi:hypothetical protein